MVGREGTTKLSQGGWGKLARRFGPALFYFRDELLPAQEKQVSDLVNKAYGLTPEEIELMWKTAPPRMPGGR